MPHTRKLFNKSRNKIIKRHTRNIKRFTRKIDGGMFFKTQKNINIDPQQFMNKLEIVYNRMNQDPSYKNEMVNAINTGKLENVKDIVSTPTPDQYYLINFLSLMKKNLKDNNYKNLFYIILYEHVNHKPIYKFENCPISANNINISPVDYKIDASFKETWNIMVANNKSNDLFENFTIEKYNIESNKLNELDKNMILLLYKEPQESYLEVQQDAITKYVTQKILIDMCERKYKAYITQLNDTGYISFMINIIIHNNLITHINKYLTQTLNTKINNVQFLHNFIIIFDYYDKLTTYLDIDYSNIKVEEYDKKQKEFTLKEKLFNNGQRNIENDKVFAKIKIEYILTKLLYLKNATSTQKFTQDVKEKLSTIYNDATGMAQNLWTESLIYRTFIQETPLETVPVAKAPTPTLRPLGTSI